MSLSTTTRIAPASNANHQPERGKRREGWAPIVPEIFSQSVTECHAARLALALRRTRVDRAQSHIEETAGSTVLATSIIDPMTQPDRVTCGSACCQMVECRANRHRALQ